MCESLLSAVITEFKFECAGLGNKQPRLGHVRKPFCPVCPVNAPNSGLHLLFISGSLSPLRWQTEIQFFLNLCLRKGFSLEETYRLFVNGYDWNNNPVSKTDYLERAKCMNDMRDLWFTKW